MSRRRPTKLSDYSADHPGIQPVRWDDESMGTLYNEARSRALDMLPRLTQIARTAAEQTDLIVRFNVGGLPQTDGQTITMPLTPAFATIDPANPCNCDRTFRCDYCFFVALLLHEAAHITEGSTEEWTMSHLYDFVMAFGEAVELIDPELEDFGPWIYDSLNRWTDFGKARAHVDGWLTDIASGVDVSDYRLYDRERHVFTLSSTVNPAAPMLINAVEDTRINRIMGKKRTALSKPLLNYILKSIGETAAGEGWRKAPVSMQVACAFALASEYNLDMTSALNSKTVDKVMADPFVKQFLDYSYESVAEVGAYMTVLAEYCYYTYRVFPRTRVGSATEPEVESARKGDALKSGNDAIDGQLKPSQQKRDQAALESLHRRVRRAVDDSLIQSELQPEDRERLAQTANPGAGLPGPLREPDDDTGAGLDTEEGVVQSGEGNYPVIILRPDLNEEGGLNVLLPGLKWPAGSDIAEFRRTGLLSSGQNLYESEIKLRCAMGVNRRTSNIPNLERGRLHGSKLARAPMGNRRVFRRIDKAAKRSYAVLLGVDLSGSTAGSTGGTADSVNDRLVKLVFRQAELLHRAGIPFAVVGHTGFSRGPHSMSRLTPGDQAALIAAGVGTGSSTTDLFLAKGFKEHWDESAQLALCSWQPGAKNLDGQTMKYYIRMLAKQRATDRLLIYYTDGQMPAEDSVRQRVILERELARAHAWSKRKHDRLTVIGVGYGCDDPKKYGLDTILVNSTESLDKQVHQVVDGLAKRIAATVGPHRKEDRG